MSSPGILSSPEVSATPTAVPLYDLKDWYRTKPLLLMAIAEQNRVHNSHCVIDRSGFLEGYVNKTSSVVLTCPSEECDFRVCAKLRKMGPDVERDALVQKKDSILQHINLCTSVPDPPKCAELLANKDFVAQATGCNSHAEIERLVRIFFMSTITTTKSAVVRETLSRMNALEGYTDGFTKLRDVLDNFKVQNPGTVYAFHRDEETKVFKHFVLVPGQSRDLVEHSATTSFALDAGFTITKHNYKAQMIVLEATDGNNNNVPVAIGMFPSESIANYSTFMSVVIGALGCTQLGGLLDRAHLLDSTDVVICTDRATSFPAALRATLPKALHRHDLWHIMKNIHDHGHKSSDSYMLNCQRATTEKEFLLHMTQWKADHPEAANFADAIDHNRWANYKALTSTTFTPAK